MAVQYDPKGKNVMLNALGAVNVLLALHTGDPGAADTAANEVAGGSPAYARKTVAWGAANAGSMPESTGNIAFDVPACTVSWVSGWDVAGTTRYWKKDVTDEVFAGQGNYTITAGTLDLMTDP